MPDMPDPLDTANLRFLRRLVTTLTAVMIFGLLAIVALLVIRLRVPAPAPLPLPANIALPDEETATAVTLGPGWYAIVTADGQILIYDRASGALRQTIDIK